MRVPTPLPRVVVAAHGPTYRVGPDLLTFKAVAEETGGAYSLFEARTPPQAAALPHIQRYEDEAIFVLEGALTLLLDNVRHELRVGDYAFVPRGTPHALANSGATPSRALILVTPGGILEQFLAEIGEPIHAPDCPPEPAGLPALPRLIAVAARYGIEILPPPDT